jgi:hypothetical protein
MEILTPMTTLRLMDCCESKRISPHLRFQPSIFPAELYG